MMDYVKVIADYRSGKLGYSKWQLRLDNDSGYWEYLGNSKREEVIASLVEAMEAEYGIPDGYEDAVNILIAAGVNADWA